MKPCANFVGGQWKVPTGLEVWPALSPYTLEALTAVPLSRGQQINEAVAAAETAFVSWARLPMKERVRPLYRLRELFISDMSLLAEKISAESGKTTSEAKAELEKAIEVMEFSLSLANLNEGGEMEVSRGITCAFRREPLGVVCGITPFNFPVMVAFWMIPNAITLGNAFIWKPSEKVSATPQLIGDLVQKAGYPAGVFSILNGDRQTVEALCDHPDIAALAFVGSSAAARSVYRRASSHGKRALCLGGAKNQMILLPDADVAMTVPAIVDSFTGCAGQRCMAGSVLLAIGESDALIDEVIAEARKRKLGQDIGCLIDGAARQRLMDAIESAEARGVKILLDGRKMSAPPEFPRGLWLGPTILETENIDDECLTSELFGPVLTVTRLKTLEEAMQIEAQSIYGNATVIFTRDAAAARQVSQYAGSGMIGINVGIPVPREPFSFGGRKASKFGHGEITGMGSLSFWSDLKKITTKWQDSGSRHWMG